MRALITMALLVLAQVSHAGQKHWTPDYLKAEGYAIVVDMPCNWTRDLSKLYIFGFYGPHNDDLRDYPLSPEVSRPFNGPNLAIKFDKDIAEPVDGRPLFRVVMWFEETNRECQGSFGFNSFVR